MKLTKLQAFNFEGAFRGMRSPLESWDRSDSIFDLIKTEEMDDCFFEIAANWVENEGKNPSEEHELINEYKNWLSNIGIINRGKHVIQVALLGPKDLELAQKLIKAGSEHRKFLRQIFVSFDLTAPLYFWKEFDTYKIGTVANSTSTMHKLASTPITLNCFETDDYQPDLVYLEGTDEMGDNPFDYFLCISDMIEPDSKELNTYEEPTIIKFLEELRLAYLETGDKVYWKELIRWLPESWLQTRTITMTYENILNLIHQRNNHKLSEWNWLINEFKKLPYSYELLFFTLEKKENENDNQSLQ